MFFASAEIEIRITHSVRVLTNPKMMKITVLQSHGGVEHKTDKTNVFPCQVQNSSNDYVLKRTNKDETKKKISVWIG